MKKNFFLLITCCYIILTLCSCNWIRGVLGKERKIGCGTNGKNVGAEKLAANDPKALKAAKKAKKFKYDTMY